MGNDESKKMEDKEKELTKHFKQRREEVINRRDLTKEQVDAVDYYIEHCKWLRMNPGLCQNPDKDKLKPLYGTTITQEIHN